MYELRVSSGMHRCATLPLCDKTILIGSGKDVDLMLADASVYPRHAMLRSRDGDWILSAADGPVYASGDDSASPDIVMPPGFFARVGGVWVTVVEQGALWAEPPAVCVPGVDPLSEIVTQEPPPLKPRTFARHGARLFALGAISLAAAAYAVATKSPDDTVPATAAAAPVFNASPGSVQLREEFRNRLEQSGLLNRLALALDDREWRMKGELDDEETRQFEHVLVRFMHEHRISFPVQANVTRAAAKLPFRISQVISGPNAAIVTEEGERIAVGESYRGVRLAAVRDHRVILAGKRKIEVHW